MGNIKLLCSLKNRPQMAAKRRVRAVGGWDPACLGHSAALNTETSLSKSLLPPPAPRGHQLCGTAAAS